VAITSEIARDIYLLMLPRYALGACFIRAMSVLRLVRRTTDGPSVRITPLLIGISSDSQPVRYQFFHLKAAPRCCTPLQAAVPMRYGRT
jgi:hypothetical protein